MYDDITLKQTFSTPFDLQTCRTAVKFPRHWYTFCFKSTVVPSSLHWSP